MLDEDKRKKMHDSMQAKQEEVKFVRNIVGKIALGIIVVCLLVVGGGYLYVKSALKPVDPNATEKIQVEIPIGSGLSLIANELADKGVIKSAKIFKYYTKFKNESSFQAGTYGLTQAMTLDEIIESLKTGTIYREPIFKMTVPEGLTLDQIGAVVAKHTDFTAKQFMDVVTSDAFVEKMKANYPELVTDAVDGENIRYKLEGYLYPATYPIFDEKPTIEGIAETMISTMNDTVMQYKGLMQEREMTPHELLTFASLLEKEATAQTDRETIASVFYNRIGADMPLQTDPTVLYSLGEHKDVVLYKDLEVDNPYNTYKNKGLTPGPIAAPGDVSIQATLNPTSTEYFYFLADKDGVNHFAKTYEEHQANEKKYIPQ